MKLESYWLDTAPAFESAAQGDVAGRADVVVIGGGFTGLSAALALARRGARSSCWKRAASSARPRAAMAVIATAAWRTTSPRWPRGSGVGQARAFYRAYTAAVDTVERLVQEEDIDCDFMRRGKLKLAAKPEHYDKLARACELLRARSRSERRDGAARPHPRRSRLRQVLRRPAAEHQCADARGQVRCRARAGGGTHTARASTNMRR